MDKGGGENPYPQNVDKNNVFLTPPLSSNGLDKYIKELISKLTNPNS